MKKVLVSQSVFLVSAILTSFSVAQDGSQSPLVTEYRVHPHRVDNTRLPEITSSLLLNGRVVSHLTEWQAEGLAFAGDSRNTAVVPYTLRTIDSQVLQSISLNNIFRSDQTSTYFQFRGAQNQRQVKLTVNEPKTMLGMQLQSTLTGECELIGNTTNKENAQCSFTPSLMVDREALDPDFFLPTIINQDNNLGQEVSPESLVILAQPGFQNVGVNGQGIGLDIYLPNIGLLPGNKQTTRTGVEREEELKHTAHMSYSTARQVLQSGTSKAIYSRTIRGVPYLHENDNAALGPLLGLLARWLPDVVPDLAGSEEAHDTKINMNLLRASNNSWSPGNSWTVYQAGFGYSDHPEVGQLPPKVWFNNVWLGLSPVTERNVSFNNFLNPTSAQSVISSAGAEGGSLKPIHLVVESESGLNIIDTKLLPSNIDDYYLQLYLSMTSQDVDLVSSSYLFEQTDWYTHLNFSGNLTGNNYIWRYYAGTINSPKSKSYLGSDMIHHFSDWSVGIGAVYYNEQDVDYFSQVNASVSRRFELSERWQTRAYSDLRYAYDRKPTVSALVEPPENYSRVGIELGYDSKASLDIYHYFDMLTNSISETPGADFSYRLRDGWSLQSWLHPGTQVKSRGVGMEYSVQKPSHTIKMTANWVHQTQEYGEDPFYNGLETDQNVFMLRVEMSK